MIEFYKENGIPENGGIDKDTFEIKIFGIKLKFPNPKFRKDVTHIHDLQHILNDCDTSWKGEAFIAGWEISTGMWKYFPVCTFSFWAMGYSLWLHPKAVFSGFKKGLNDIGIIDLMLSVPNQETSNYYDFIKPLLMDEESRQMFQMPAQYLLVVESPL